MKLPIAQDASGDADTLTRAAQRAILVLARTTVEPGEEPFASLWMCEERPDDPGLNFAADVRPDPDSTDDPVAAIVTAFDEHNLTCHRLLANGVAFEPEIVKAAQPHGFAPADRIVWRARAVTGPEATPDDDLQILPVRSVYPEATTFFTEQAKQADNPDPTATAKTVIDQLDEPRLEAFFARRDGQPVASAGVLVLGSIGILKLVSDWPTDPESDAGRVLAHTLEHCMRAQLEHVIVDQPDSDTHAEALTGLGFERLGTLPVLETAP
ncbi:MAG: hypothetical protein R3336_06300 [Phycisphaeraceae bacterium]|nr:hypothetical protein [Phycisphaeraceae bacterium]